MHDLQDILYRANAVAQLDAVIGRLSASPAIAQPERAWLLSLLGSVAADSPGVYRLTTGVPAQSRAESSVLLDLLLSTRDRDAVGARVQQFGRVLDYLTSQGPALSEEGREAVLQFARMVRNHLIGSPTPAPSGNIFAQDC